MDIAEVHRIAVTDLNAQVQDIQADQWDLPTPNTGWNVRDLVDHLIGGTVCVAPLVQGQTIAAIGSRFEGDLAGEDPREAFARTAEEAMAAVDAPGAAERTVDLSRGPTPAADYILERIADAAMHTWDLATALGRRVSLHPEVVAYGRRLLAEQGEAWRQGGALGPVVPVPDDADEQTRFIAESGRTP